MKRKLLSSINKVFGVNPDTQFFHFLDLVAEWTFRWFCYQVAARELIGENFVNYLIADLGMFQSGNGDVLVLQDGRCWWQLGRPELFCHETGKSRACYKKCCSYNMNIFVCQKIQIFEKKKYLPIFLLLVCKMCNLWKLALRNFPKTYFGFVLEISVFGLLQNLNVIESFTRTHFYKSQRHFMSFALWMYRVNKTVISA